MKQPKEIVPTQRTAEPYLRSIVLSPAIASTSSILRFGILLAIFLGTTFANAQQRDVLTGRYDDSRTGAALTETLLTPNAIDTKIDTKGVLRNNLVTFSGASGSELWCNSIPHESHEETCSRWRVAHRRL